MEIKGAAYPAVLPVKVHTTKKTCHIGGEVAPHTVQMDLSNESSTGT